MTKIYSVIKKENGSWKSDFGYSNNIDHAMLYTEEEAIKICFNGNVYKTDSLTMVVNPNKTLYHEKMIRTAALKEAAEIASKESSKWATKNNDIEEEKQITASIIEKGIHSLIEDKE